LLGVGFLHFNNIIVFFFCFFFRNVEEESDEEEYQTYHGKQATVGFIFHIYHLIF
jgi:hypothetical protein